MATEEGIQHREENNICNNTINKSSILPVSCFTNMQPLVFLYETIPDLNL